MLYPFYRLCRVAVIILILLSGSSFAPPLPAAAEPTAEPFLRNPSWVDYNRERSFFLGPRPHKGIDFKTQTRLVVAASSGIIHHVSVIEEKGNPAWCAAEGGRFNSPQREVIIRHSNGYKTGYLHLSEFGFNPRTGQPWKPGDIVFAGEVIGRSGSSGCVNGPHLHFWVADEADRVINPDLPNLWTNFYPDSGVFEQPVQGTVVAGPITLSGWARVKKRFNPTIKEYADDSSGVIDRVEIWLFEADGSNPRKLGNAMYGLARPGEENGYGWSYEWDPAGLPNRSYLLQAQSVASNGTTSVLKDVRYRSDSVPLRDNDSGSVRVTVNRGQGAKGHGGCLSWEASRIDCFVRGTDNAMWHKWWDGAHWNAWESLGGVLESDPECVSWAINRIDCFVVGINAEMWHKWWDGQAWHGWETLGGTLTGAPQCVARDVNWIDCFTKGNDRFLYQTTWNGQSWSGWQSRGGRLESQPNCLAWGTQRIDCFARGAADDMVHIFSNNGTWSNWESLGGTLKSRPECSSWAPNRIDCFVQGTDDAMWHNWWDGRAWNGWVSRQGTLTSAPTCLSRTAETIDCFALGTDNFLYQASWRNGVWIGWQSRGGQLTLAPECVAPHANRIDCFARGTTGHFYHTWWNGAAWQPWEDLDGSLVGPPSVTAAENQGLPFVFLGWEQQIDATEYQLQLLTTGSLVQPSTTSLTTTIPMVDLRLNMGEYAVKVRGCNGVACSDFSAATPITVTSMLYRHFIPLTNP